MRNAEADGAGTCERAHVPAVRGARERAANASVICRASLDTPLRTFGRENSCGGNSLTASLRREASRHSSCRSARSMLRARGIREEIIGHRMTSFLPGNGCRRLGRFTFAVFHEPTREHGGRSLLNPLIHEGSHLLAKIRGMAQAREFVRLKTVARGGQQKFPRRLNVVAGHSVPPQ